MISKRDIIIFGDDWGRYPSTIQHIGKVLAKYNRIVWIGSLGLRKPELSLYDATRIWEKGKRIIFMGNNSKNHIVLDEEVYEVNPFIIPFHDIEIIYRINMRIVRLTILNLMRRLQIQKPILITSSPIIHDIIGNLNESSSHYFCLDDFTLFEGAFDTLGEKEQLLISKVNSCFSISDGLMRTRRVNSSHNYFLPQGVNINHFIPSKSEIADLVKGFNSPVIGFFGIITNWVDIELLVMCAKHYPDYNFVVLGKATVDLSIFASVDNIHYMGEIPFSDLPKYARIFNVGLIPFVVNDLTIACNPLKLLEYLSLGIPVVSTNLPEVKKLEPHVIIGETREKFIEGIKIAVDQISDKGNIGRRKFAEKYSWESIAEDISIKIIDIENEKFSNGITV